MAEIRHGTFGSYNQHRCRCVTCRDFWAVYQRMRRGGSENPSRPPHGTANCYRNGCRQDECREAHRVYMADYRKTVKERQTRQRAANRRRAMGS